MASQRNSRRASTLVELIIAATLFAIVSGMVVEVHLSGSRSIRSGSVQGDVDIRTSRALERIAMELTFASSDSLSGFPPSPSFDTTVTFDVAGSLDPATGTVDWQPMRIQFEYSPAELDDGVDNDGNGLVDDGLVVMYRAWSTSDERRVVLARGVSEYLEGETPDGNDENGNLLVDESGLCFERVDGRLNVYLTLQRRDPEGHLAQQTLQTSVHYRN